jgi:hypothetical protein
MGKPLRIQCPAAWYHITSRDKKRCSWPSIDKPLSLFLNLTQSALQINVTQDHLMGQGKHLAFRLMRCLQKFVVRTRANLNE